MCLTLFCRVTCGHSVPAPRPLLKGGNSGTVEFGRSLSHAVLSLGAWSLTCERLLTLPPTPPDVPKLLFCPRLACQLTSAIPRLKEKPAKDSRWFRGCTRWLGYCPGVDIRASEDRQPDITGALPMQRPQGPSKQYKFQKEGKYIQRTNSGLPPRSYSKQRRGPTFLWLQEATYCQWQT